MTRTARLEAPSAIHHVIARCVDHEYRIRGDAERAEYLQRLGRALARCDWSVLGYALMSNHIHLVCRAGEAPSERLIRRLHTGFALWLNRAQRRYGPVFAERHTTIVVPDERAGRLLAYVHNNPVRAGVAREPAASTWTSHAAYLGLEPPPPWLDVEDGLRASGFDTSTRGRAAFHRLALAHAGDGRDDVLSGDPREALRAIRQQAGAPVGITAAAVTVDEPARKRHDVLTHAGLTLRPRWPGDPAAVVAAAAELVGVTVESIRSRQRSRKVVAARRLALLVWTGALGRKQREMAPSLGLCHAAASQLLHRNDAAIARLARPAELLAALCWAQAESEFRNTVPESEFA